jgi:2-polyprenyl-6-methoxyphenol hydroxylase-like FAD-dependent oxidoreductase
VDWHARFNLALKDMKYTSLNNSTKWSNSVPPNIHMPNIGDSIGIFPNAGRFFPRWGVHDEMMSYCGISRGWKMIRYDGVVLGESRPPPGFQFPKDAPLYDCHRADMHRLLFETAARMGAKLHLGSRVEKYAEDYDGAEVTVNGRTWRGDVVIGADGVKSRARMPVIGYEDKTLASGYALYRAFFDANIIKNDPLTSHLVLDDDDARTGWIGPDVHAIVATIKRGKEFNWVLTHRDESGIDESWVFPGKTEEALKCIEGWDPVIRRVVELTPKESLLDWKLMFREPLPTVTHTSKTRS